MNERPRTSQFPTEPYLWNALIFISSPRVGLKFLSLEYSKKLTVPSLNDAST